MIAAAALSSLITAVVRFRVRNGAARVAAREVFEQATPAKEIPGLIRKYYLGGEGPGGGLYFWQDREAAERFYSPEWRRALAERFGVEPEVLFIERSAEQWD